MHPRTKLRNFEFQIHRRLKKIVNLEGARLLVTCSGGADSVALVHLMEALSKRMKFTMAIAHIHHGPRDHVAENGSGERTRAQKFVASLAEKLELSFISNDGEKMALGSQSESSLRNLRRELLDTWRTSKENEGPFSYLVFGHHADDLLETRLIRLMRGTGPEGIMSMREARDGILRPLLTRTRGEIRRYLLEISAHWLEDSSNQDSSYLRNWIRNDWLPQLEAIRPTSCSKMSQSLDAIASALESSAESHMNPREAYYQIKHDGKFELSLFLFRDLGRDKQQQVLASLLGTLLRRGLVSEFKQTHVLEILKRLDTRRKVHTFSLLGLTWEVIDRRVQIDSRKLE